MDSDITPLPDHWQAFRRVPSEYLIAAKGDVSVAATLAEVDEASFMRALGSDASIADVARSAHFLTLMHSLDLVTLAKEEIARRFTELPSGADDPTSPGFDPQIANPAASFDVKTLVSIFKFGAEFIALSAASASAAQRASNNAPARGKIIEAARGLPPISSLTNGSPPPTPSLEAPPEVEPTPEAQEMLDNLTERLANSPPEIRAMFQEALDRAKEQPDGDLPPAPSNPIE